MLGDGGKWVCGLDRIAKQDKCVIYSFGQLIPFPRSNSAEHTDLDPASVTGVENESSFESTVLQRAPSCEVWGYDYSVDSVCALPSNTPKWIC